MFQNLSTNISQIFRKLSGTDKISKNIVQQGAEEIKKALLEADVAKEVIDSLINTFNQKALGQEVPQGAKPADMLLKLFHDELVHIMGEGSDFNLNIKKVPSQIMLVGLQGSGKTTFAARIGKEIQKKYDKKVLLVSVDIYRPAAIDQLETLAKDADCGFFPSSPNQKPIEIIKKAQQHLREKHYDVLIIDTAGRTHIDQEMMDECKEIAQITQPEELLFVIDSMTGQDAVKIAKSFNQILELTGIILSKTDGDSRGGAALSTQHIIKKPIKYITTGEKIDDIDNFDPKRIASQILGMGDIVGLIKELEEKIDQKKAEKMAKKIMKQPGQFDFQDLKDQLMQMKSMGGIKSIMKKMPSLGIPAQALEKKLDTEKLDEMIYLIDSMTKHEQNFPTLVMNVASRKKRICQGSGRSMQELNLLLKTLKRMQKTMGLFKGKKMQSLMSQAAKMFGNGKMPEDFKDL